MVRVALLFLCAVGYVWGNSYEVPPSSSTYGYVPVISDRQMEECVRVYNEILSMERSINPQVSQYNSYVDWYNTNCAGKQSQSACEAANKLNRQRGLPEQRCY